MPSPIAHIAVGAIIGVAVSNKSQDKRLMWAAPAVCILFSIMPDFDLLAGFLMRDIGTYHNQFTHSPGFGLMACLVLTPVMRKFLPGLRVGQVFALIALCYGLHIVMDFMTYGRGLKLLWPFSEDRFRSPVLLFYGVRWSDGLFTAKHFITLANETVFVGFCLLAVWLRRKACRGGV